MFLQTASKPITDRLQLGADSSELRHSTNKGRVPVSVLNIRLSVTTGVTGMHPSQKQVDQLKSFIDRLLDRIREDLHSEIDEQRQKMQDRNS